MRALLAFGAVLATLWITAGCAAVMQRINESRICQLLCDATATHLTLSLRAGKVCVCSEENPDGSSRLWKVPIGVQLRAGR